MRPPRGIYFVAIAFFVATVICLSELLNTISDALGIDQSLNLATIHWLLALGFAALCLTCYGVVLLVRLHPVPRWLMFAMTLFLTVQMAVTPTGGSPFYTPSRIALNRLLLVLPMIASCVYLLRPGIRAAGRGFTTRVR